MGFLSFRRGRRAPSPIPILQYQSTLLDHFSQEVGSASSASSWDIPDIINRRVEARSFSPSDLQSPRYSMGSLGKAPMGLRVGNMDEFGDCDPSSPTTLGRYQDWIDQDSQAEQSSLRQGSQENLQTIRQVSLPSELKVNTGIAPESSAATTGLHAQVFHSPPSVDDSDEDEEPDELSCRCAYGLNRAFFIGSDDGSDDGFMSDDSSDSDDEVVVRIDIDSADSSRGRTVCHEPNLQDNDGIRQDVQFNPPIMCYEPDFKYFADDYRSDEDQELHSSRVHCSGPVLIEDSEEVADYRDSFRGLPHLDGYVITYRSLNYPFGADMDDYKYDAYFEGSQTMWNSNREILQGSDSPDYEDFENWSHINAIDNSNDTNLESFRSFNTSILCSRTPVSNNDANYRHDAFSFEQYLYSPFSPAGHHHLSFDFATPKSPRDIHVRLQCPAKFNYSRVNPYPHCECQIIFCGQITAMHGAPHPMLTIPDRSSFGYHAPRIAMLYGRPYMLYLKSWLRGMGCRAYLPDMLKEPPLRREKFANAVGNRFPLTVRHDELSFPVGTFGNGTSDGFPFTFTCDEPRFPRQACS